MKEKQSKLVHQGTAAPFERGFSTDHRKKIENEFSNSPIFEGKGSINSGQRNRSDEGSKAEFMSSGVVTDNYQTNLTPRTNAKLGEGLDMKKVNMLMETEEIIDSGSGCVSIYTNTFVEEEREDQLRAPLAEIIEEDELRNINEDIGKTSLRIKPQKNERRYSRISFGKQKTLSKVVGVNVRFGITME